MLSNLTTYQKLLLLKKTAGGGVRIVTKTLKGNAPLVFTAVAKPLVSLIQYGKTEQAATPTPSAPVDIVCNNGALKMRHRSGLPNGYKLLEYIGGSGSQYVITDVYLASTDVVECEFRNSTTTGYGAVYGVFKLGESSALYGNQTYYGYDAANDKVGTEIRINTDWHSSRHDFVNGTLTVDDTTVTFTPFEFANTEKNAVLSRYCNNSYGYNWKGYIRKFKVTRGGEVICDLLPAKDSNDVAGLYDLISGNFYTATGGTLLEGDVVDDYELYVDGTPEVLKAGGKNLFYNDEAWEDGFFLTSGKVAKAGSNRTFVMRCTPNTTYYWKHCSLVGGVRAFTVDADTVEIDANGVWIKQNPVVGEINEVYSATTGANAKWLCVCFGRNQNGAAPIADQWSDFMLSVSPLTEDTPYEPYREPQTASVQNLYQVGDYKDEQDIISGAITRRVGVKVLDGTENWGAKNATSGQTITRVNDMLNQSSAPLIVTHGEWSTSATKDSNKWRVVVGPYLACFPSQETTADFKAFLASQYAAGTPVIVLYPLAEEQTETVSPQALSTEQGVNTIQVDAEVSPIELEVSYKDKQ